VDSLLAWGILVQRAKVQVPDLHSFHDLRFADVAFT